MNPMQRALGTACPQWPGRLSRTARLGLELLEGLKGGALALELPDGTQLRVGHGPLVAHWRVKDPRVFEMALGRGDIGLAEAWMDGLWDSDGEDPTPVLALLASNRDTLGRAVYGRFLRLATYRIWHRLRANTRVGARRNIEAHYDLGNDFYRLWLDDTMTYSSALFASPEESLEDAQRRKYRRILERLGARPGQTILEIGCGWGGFAEVAATEFGCRLLCLTLSPAQLAFARERAKRGGYADRVAFELCDYRDVHGRYDHVVSIEMIEAVGERFWPTYFERIATCLKPGGRCVIQAITIADGLFDRYRRGTDFIQRYVFPGGMLPSPGAVHRQAACAGLQVCGDFAFGRDYALTLRRWHGRFEAAVPAVRAQGFPERFVRMWRFYLAYCEAGFVAGDIDVHHYELEHRN
jgi:cyclopropane-fatty-acyl-phospholipid synthase